MLGPRERTLLLDALRPPDGYTFDEGIGTTYSLDLLALLTAPLAFTLFQQSDEPDKAGPTSLELLESVRRYSERLTIFCQAGRIALPRAKYPQLAYLETAVVQCAPPPGGSFHPKLWVLRYKSAESAPIYRILCLTRNLTFARSWDTVLTLEGRPRAGGLVRESEPLASFVESLPRSSTGPNASDATSRVQRIANEIRQVEFAAPEGFKFVRFWPLGIPNGSPWPFRDVDGRMLVISPFLAQGCLERLSDGRPGSQLISTADSLGKLARKPKAIANYWVLDEAAVAEESESSEDHAEPATVADAVQLSDLHAKCYIVEAGREVHIWSGSANATESAFGTNVEFLIELTALRSLAGIDRLLATDREASALGSMLKAADHVVGLTPQDEAQVALDRIVEEARSAIASVGLTLAVAPIGKDTFSLSLTPDAAPKGVPPDIDVSCWPLLLGESRATEIDPSKIVWGRFEHVSFEALSSFVAIRLHARRNGIEQTCQFILNATLVGAPADRKQRILLSLIKDQARLLQFFYLLLTDAGLPLETGTTPGGEEGWFARAAASGTIPGLFEMLLRALDRTPERLDEIASILSDLARTPEGRAIVPGDLERVWAPIWESRERLRGRLAQ